MAEQSQEVVELLRRRRVREARRVMGHVLKHAAAGARQLQRQEDTARALLRACVQYVGAVAARGTAGARRRALAEALSCRIRVRDLRVPLDTPSDVIGIFAEADSVLTRREEMAAPVRVTSSPEGCGVYADGIWAGATPLTLRRPLQGELQVQVQCRGATDPGRARVVRPGEGGLAIHVDTGFERRLSTGDGLRYRDACDYARHSAADARSLAQSLDLAAVVLVESVDGGLRYVEGGATRPTFRWVDVGAGDTIAAMEPADALQDPWPRRGCE